MLSLCIMKHFIFKHLINIYLVIQKKKKNYLWEHAEMSPKPKFFLVFYATNDGK